MMHKDQQKAMVIMGGRRRLGLMLVLSVVVALGGGALLRVAPTQAATCPQLNALAVPGADHQQQACLDDITTTGLLASGNADKTDPSDYATLNAAGTINPSGVSGIQIDGSFPDTSTTNTYHGWNHDAQFVLRLPNTWNGKLVITGAPGIRRQYALDFLISDWVLAQGYAFAATDKGNNGQQFYRDGLTAGDAVAEWHQRVTELTLAAKQVVAQRYGRAPDRTYVTGISNGGYLTRYALENHAELYDGGVDWEGTLFRPDGPNLLTYLPTALKYYPLYRATGDQAAHDALIAAGFPPGSEFFWDYHYGVYWDLTQRTYREEFDPDYDGATEAGTQFCPSGTPQCDADYNYAMRPQAVKDAIAKVSLTGKIGKPMLTLHGTLDTLLPIKTDSDVYTRMIADAGRGAMHRYYVIEAGNHVDSLYNTYPMQLRPILPCYRVAFTAMTAWVESGLQQEPPPSQFVPKPVSGDVINTCALEPAAVLTPTTSAPTPMATGTAVSPTTAPTLTTTPVLPTAVPTATNGTTITTGQTRRLFLPLVQR